jgi:hypothetical protein
VAGIPIMQAILPEEMETGIILNTASTIARIFHYQFCRTAFMVGNTTFSSLGLTEEVWGWAHYFDVEDGNSQSFAFYTEAYNDDLEDRL